MKGSRDKRVPPPKPEAGNELFSLFFRDAAVTCDADPPKGGNHKITSIKPKSFFTWTACSLLVRQSVCDGGLPLWPKQPACPP
jgi:hypothetical protein